MIYLITGAGRGLGKTFTELYLARPSNIVIAALRDVNGPASIILENLPRGDYTRLCIVHIHSEKEEDPGNAIKFLEDNGVIDHIDTVIANAGIYDDYEPLHTVSSDAVRRHMEINGYGPLWLFQAVYPLLKKSSHPKWVGIGSSLGSLASMLNSHPPSSAYGPSKAFLHWITLKIHHENEEFTSFILEPGATQTDLGYRFARGVSALPPLSIRDSVKSMIVVIDQAHRKDYGGQFLKRRPGIGNEPDKLVW